MLNLEEILQRGQSTIGEHKKLAQKLKRTKPKNLDKIVHELHDEQFERIDCLDCGNCCKTTSPGMHGKDLERLAKHLKIKVSELIDQHMEIDNDGDYVFRSAPCPFLGSDNYCSVYEARPLACREYPHTNRKRFYQLIDLSIKNTEICPAVVGIFENLKKNYT